jgi:D-serine deaminase-like pyridoxal phosphate-dependent protein
MTQLNDLRIFIGRPLTALPTPCLVVDIEALDYNLNLMSDYFATRHAKLRPHFKSNKCVTLAQRQLRAGSVTGITCAKLAEAEALVAGGIKDVLIANQVIGPDKAARLARLNRDAVVRVAVDSEAGILQLGEAAAEAGVTIPVLVEVDIGMRRCGVPAGAPALALAHKAHTTRGLRLDGLQGYEGHLVMRPDFEERKTMVTEAMQPLLATRQALMGAGLPCPIASSAGTGTYDITGNLPGIDEIQAGSYALMDCHYKKIRPEFRNALTVLATIISSGDGFGVADVGLKGMGNDFGLPAVMDAPHVKPRYIAEEHVPLDGMTAPVGSKVRLIPSHGCTTCNLHRRLWIVRNDTIEDCWPIEGSGCLE